MKKFIFLIPLALVFQSCGIFLGFGLSDILGGSFDDPVGAQVSVETKVYELNDNSSLSSGLGVSFQGGSYHDTEGSGTVHLAYLNVPMLYTYETPKRFYGEIGLQPGFLIRAKDNFEGVTYDYKDYASKFQLGLPVGIGYKLNENFSVGVRSTYGITSVENSEGGYHNFLTIFHLNYLLNWSLFNK